MFKAYEAVRDKWAILDCYKSPGPIQFSGAGSDEINFMVQPPNIDVLMQETQKSEEAEKAGVFHSYELLSELSRSRVSEACPIPEQLEKGLVGVAAVKKFFAQTGHVDELISEQLPKLSHHTSANYFVEVQDRLLLNKTFRQDDENLARFNEQLINVNQNQPLRIGLAYMGRQAPGANNVVDGLLRFAEHN